MSQPSKLRPLDSHTMPVANGGTKLITSHSLGDLVHKSNRLVAFLSSYSTGNDPYMTIGNTGASFPTVSVGWLVRCFGDSVLNQLHPLDTPLAVQTANGLGIELIRASCLSFRSMPRMMIV